jgi:hypothetical protein
VTDEPTDKESKDTSPTGGPRTHAGRPIDPRYYQRNLANRLFPGPSELMSKQARQRIDGLLTPLDGRGHGQPRGIANPKDVAQVGEKLEEQNELLRAILASSVDTQEDARATAQNSRTFAWAGTAIALLTLIATVIAIVAAIRA